MGSLKYLAPGRKRQSIAWARWSRGEGTGGKAMADSSGVW